MRRICWTLWIALGLSLALPTFLLASIFGNPQLDGFGILCIIGLIYVIFDIGKTVVTLPPSKCKSNIEIK